MTRAIMEGMDQDRTCINYVAHELGLISEDVTKLTYWSSIDVELAGNIGDNREFIENPETSLPTVEFEIPYHPLVIPQSLQTIILEDGRVYRSNFDQKDDDPRFNVVMGDLKVGGFEPMYEVIHENPERYYS